MTHEPALSRSEEWGPCTLRCSCGWTLTGEQWTLWLRFDGHKASNQQSQTRGSCTPWGIGRT